MSFLKKLFSCKCQKDCKCGASEKCDCEKKTCCSKEEKPVSAPVESAPVQEGNPQM